MLKRGDRVRFDPTASARFWPGTDVYPTPGTVGIVLFVPKPEAYGGAVVVRWPGGREQAFGGLNAEALVLVHK